MSVKIIDISIYSELTGAAVDWALANIDDKIQIKYTFQCSRYSISSTSNPFILNITDGYIGDGWVKSSNNAFKGMKIGDTILWYNYVSNTLLDTLTIIDKLSDNEVQFDHDLPLVGDDSTSFQSLFSLQKPFTAIKYRWNFIENSEGLTYDSKVTGQEQLLKIEYIEADDLTVLPMQFVGTKEYQIGSATIKGTSISTDPYYINTFELVHTTFITPFMLASQRTDLINGIPPTYFDNNKCLKLVYNIQALYQYTNPSEYEQVIEFSKTGNTGWFNENFNNVPTNYYIEDLVYRRWLTFEAIPSLEMTTEKQTVTFKIRNTVDMPFVDLSTKYVLNFTKVPFDESEYKLNGRLMKDNFVFDRQITTLGDPDINGDNFGTTMQVLTTIATAYTDAGNIEVSCIVEFGAEALAIIQESELSSYRISVSIQNSALATAVADKVTLLIDVDEFSIVTSDPTMIITDGEFLRHFESDPDTEGNSVLDVFPEDEVVNYNRFYIDKNGRESDVILLKSIQMKVKAKNSDTLDEFTLDSISPMDLTSLGFDSFGLQYADINLNRIFHIPSTEIRKKIRFKRRADLDNSNKYYYEVYFPFLVRWEYFIKLATVNPDFFDLTEPNNGLNEFWDRFAHLGDWDLYYELTIIATKNGVLQQYKTENKFSSNDWGSNAEWEPTSIKAYDVDTDDELFDISADKKYIYGYKNTKIVALFTNIDGGIDIDNYVVNFGIESFEGTGIAERTRMSSKWASDSDTWFKSIDSSSKTILSLEDADTVRAEVLVDFTKIPTKPIFKIAARLYDISPTVVEVEKRTQDGTFKKMQDGTQKIMN